MDKVTISAFFEDDAKAASAVGRLEVGGIPETDIRLLGGVGASASSGGLIGGLTSSGIQEDHAHAYAEGIRRGGSLVTAKVEQRLVEKAIGILDGEGRVNIDEQMTAWRRDGWSGRHAEPT